MEDTAREPPNSEVFQLKQEKFFCQLSVGGHQGRSPHDCQYNNQTIWRRSLHASSACRPRIRMGVVWELGGVHVKAAAASQVMEEHI